MNLSATILLAFGMSMDAFAASIGKGATLHKPKFSEAVRTGLIFGAIETLTPLVGWGLGMLASQFILEWNHWIAFILLVFLGGRMIVEGFRLFHQLVQDTQKNTDVFEMKTGCLINISIRKTR